MDPAGKITKARIVKMTWFATRDWDLNRVDDKCVRPACPLLPACCCCCCARSCRALSASGTRCYDADTNPKGVKGCNPVLLWELKFAKEVAKWNEQSKHVKAMIQAENSVSEALGAVIGGDVILLNSGFFVIIMYAILVLGKFHPVLSRSAAAFAGVASVGMSIGATYGLNGYFGVMQTPVTSVLPFILLGIGVDDMFVLAGALERAKKHGGTIEDRIGRMMGSAGASITMTSLTDALAFALGCTTSFPALQAFCIYATIGILLDFFFQITFFTAAMVFDEQRVEGQKRDCFCCVAPCYKDSPERGQCCACCRIPDDKMDQSCCCGTGCMKEGGYLRGFFRDYYAPALKNKIVKALVVIVFMGLFAVGAYGVTQLTEDFSLRFFVNDGSPLLDVFDIQDKEYRTGTIQVSVLLDHRKEMTETYLQSETARTDVFKLEKAVRDFEWSVEDSFENPIRKLNEYIVESADELPLSPKFFHVPGYGDYSSFLGNTVNMSGRTVYLDTRAEDSQGNQGGISSGKWKRLRTTEFMANLGNNETMYIKDQKLFFDMLHHFLTTAQGAGYRSYFSPFEWYEKFTEWIENEPEVLNTYDFSGTQITLDKRREAARGGLNDVHNDTARPKDPEKFCQLLRYFLSTNETLKNMVQPPLDDSDAKCYPASGDIQMTRMVVDMKCAIEGGVCPNSNATAEVLAMQGIRKVVSDANSKLKPRAYSFAFLFTEQYAVVRNEALMNLSLALVAVAIVMFVLIAHPFTAILVVLNTAFVLADIIGMMWLWDISINSISIINLVLAIGLAVDYSAHVAHAFMSAGGTRDERMVTALTEMGADVCHGAISTFLAVLVLAFSKSYIFRMFFKQFFGICLFGMTHGLMLLPVVLSLVGPPTHKDHSHAAEGKNASADADAAEAKPAAVAVEVSSGPGVINSMAAPVAMQSNPDLAIGVPTGTTNEPQNGNIC